MEVKINREIRNYTEAVFFGLSLRQIIFSTEKSVTIQKQYSLVCHLDRSFFLSVRLRFRLACSSC